MWYPGWRATVDGAPAPLLRANYAFRAVRLEPGQHQVHLTFAPRSWRLGLAISGLTLLVLVGWGLWECFHPLPLALQLCCVPEHWRSWCYLLLLV